MIDHYLKYKLVLASSSPRRNELLKHLNIPFTIFEPKVDETLDPKLKLAEQCQLLSRKKAEFVKTKQGILNAGVIYLAADTLVEIDQKILEKPKSVDDAQNMLRQLSGKTHHVVTGITLLINDIKNHWHEHTTYAETKVTFHSLSDQIINYYVATGEPMDKAGAYGIQGFGLSFVKSIQGTYANVVGLPLDLVVQFFEKTLASETKTWTENFI